LFEKAKIVAEPSGAATVAAALQGLADSFGAGGPIVAIVSGGNVALGKLEELRRSRRDDSQEDGSKRGNQ
jgi:threonine dehydratase